jgi:hypothetical protein
MVVRAARNDADQASRLTGVHHTVRRSKCRNLRPAAGASYAEAISARPAGPSSKPRRPVRLRRKGVELEDGETLECVVHFADGLGHGSLAVRVEQRA